MAESATYPYEGLTVDPRFVVEPKGEEYVVLDQETNRQIFASPDPARAEGYADRMNEIMVPA